jgi:hypothetical protein
MVGKFESRVRTTVFIIICVFGSIHFVRLHPLPVGGADLISNVHTWNLATKNGELSVSST